MGLDVLSGIIGGDAGRWLGSLHATSSIGDFVFFRLIFDYLHEEIAKFGIQLMGRMMKWVGAMALTLMILWVFVQGFRIVTGRSRDSMMLLVMNASRATLVVSIATTMAMFGSNLHTFLTEDLSKEITEVVTGEDKSASDQIDENLAYMQLALSSIDVLDVADDQILDREKTRAMWFVGFGTGGPAVTAGALLLVYEVALALFIGLGPLFVLCLLFDQTKSLFQRWLFYGIGTMFSMAVLAMMTSIAMKMVAKVAASFWGSTLLGDLLHQNFSEGMSSMAMQQGGMGLILTTLILTAPPMAAMFFQGTLGNFSPYATMGAHLRPQGGAPGGVPASAYPDPKRAGLMDHKNEFDGNRAALRFHSRDESVGNNLNPGVFGNYSGKTEG